MARVEPWGGHRFGVEIDGLVVAHFHAVSGLSWESEILPVQEGGRNDAQIKLPSQGSLGHITLKRGYSGDAALFGWMKDCREIGLGRGGVRKNVDVIVMADDGQEVGRYSLRRAWPLKWIMDEFSGSSSAQAVESIELAHEGLVWTKRGASPGGPTPGQGLSNRLARARGSALSQAQSALANARAAGAGADGPGLLDRVRGAVGQGQGLLDQARAALAAAQGLRSQLESLWRQAAAQVANAKAATDPATAMQRARNAADGALPNPPSPPQPPSAQTLTPAQVQQAVGDAKRAGAKAQGAPDAMKQRAAQGARGYVRGDKDTAKAAARAKWSDGVDEVQKATGLDEVPISHRPRIGPPF